VDKTGNLNKQVCAQRVIFSSHFLLHRIVRLYILTPYMAVDGGVNLNSRCEKCENNEECAGVRKINAGDTMPYSEMNQTFRHP